MLDKIYWLSARDIDKYISASPAVIPMLHAAIVISNPNQREIVPEWVKPQLHLSFSYFNTAAIYGKKDKVFRKQYVKQVESGSVLLPNNRDAEKIIRFCDLLGKDKNGWTLYVICPEGYGRSTAIVRFIANLLRVPTEGLSYPHLDPYDRALTQVLNLAYSNLFKESLTNEPNANIESTLRGEESNARV